MLQITYDESATGGGEITLQLAGAALKADAYFLALDSGCQPDSRSPTKVRAVLASLLGQWHELIASASAVDVVDLPFEFADEYIGCLRCQVGRDKVVITPGWLMTAGSTVVPSRACDTLPGADWEPQDDAAAVTVPRAELLNEIRRNQRMFSDTDSPRTDPTPIFEHFRGSYGTEMLVAAVAHFDLFGRLARLPRTLEELQQDLNLAERPAIVLTTALRAMGLLAADNANRFTLTPLAREHLVPGGPFDVGDYLGLAASAPGTLEMVERLRTNRPAGMDEGEAGAAFIYRDGVASAMEQADLARHFTLALAGRAKNVAPVLATVLDLKGVRTLLDVGGGTGIYSLALLKANPHLKAIVMDRPEVLKVAEEFAADYDVGDRFELLPGDMFADELPRADAILLSNILHDWDVPECRQLVTRCADALPASGRLFIHDVLLNDALDGPLPIALYSAALFTLTEGRAYSRAEYTGWLQEAGLQPGACRDTLIHCSVLEGVKKGFE
ncbi:Demethylspheroidene O-methyltransferase [Maioricimonas rarisocia]|uniref:Demethylspheroidene O-methyltransferase n=1 Tax=Maioricimonas rarisocia TaxID=2528026 RepID=A0A517Z9X7_9PLAN|nr:methyltransferase [Maioricimonas rarisocia]QDU39297.1 Demethylspheroidene O-methyltransferase [Maioricimonas rarisocia]